MSTPPQKLKLVGVFIIPDDPYADFQKRVQDHAMHELETRPPQDVNIPPPPPKFVPVYEDAAGQRFVLNDPPRDPRIVDAELQAAAEQQQALLRADARNTDDEWGQRRFKAVRDLAAKRSELLSRLKPAARPIAQRYKPPYDAEIGVDALGVGGFMKLDGPPPGVLGDPARWMAAFSDQLPHSAALNAKNARWEAQSAALRALVKDKPRSEDDEWRRGHFDRVRAAAGERNPTYESGHARPLGSGFFAKDKSWTQTPDGAFDEYHQSHFAATRKRFEQQNEAFKEIKQDVPPFVGAAAPPPLPGEAAARIAPTPREAATTPAPPTPSRDATAGPIGLVPPTAGVAEFLAQANVFGELAGPMLTFVKSSDPAYLQSYIQTFLGEQLETLADLSDARSQIRAAQAMSSPDDDDDATDAADTRAGDPAADGANAVAGNVALRQASASEAAIPTMPAMLAGDRADAAPPVLDHSNADAAPPVLDKSKADPAPPTTPVGRSGAASRRAAPPDDGRKV